MQFKAEEPAGSSGLRFGQHLPVGGLRVSGKLVLLATLGFLFCQLDVQAAYDPYGSVRRGKRWSVSSSLRTGYDDNTTTAPFNRRGSWFNSLDLSLTYSYPTDTSFFSVRTGAGGTLFSNRPDDDFDFKNAFDFTFAHTFNPRLTLDITDHLRFGQEPELAENNVILRRQGNYINNGVNTIVSYNFAPKWHFDLAFLHDLWTYDDSVLSDILGRQSYGGGPSVRYRFTEKINFCFLLK